MRHRLLTSAALAALAALTLARPVTAGPRCSAGIQFGLNENRATYDWTDAPLDIHPALTAAWSAGATLDVPIGRRFSLATGLRYIEYGDRMEVTITSTAPSPQSVRFKSHTTWRYVAVPVLVRFRPLASRGWFVEAGPEAGYLAGAGQSTSIDEIPPLTLAHPGAAGPQGARARVRPAAAIFEQVGTFDAIRPYRRWNVSVAGGTGWELPWRGHTALVGARYTHGLADIAKSSVLVRRTRGMELLAGWRW